MRGRERLRGMLGRGTTALLIAGCLLAAGAATGYAVKRDDATAAHACYRVHGDGTPVRNATLRIVSSSDSCRRNERPLVWDLHGAPGSTGATGATGATGPAGPVGQAAGADCDLERRIAAAVPDFQTSGTCAPAPLCNDDGFEPNNTLAQATPVDLGTTTSAVACALNDDLFAVPAGGATVTASLTFDSTAVLEVALLDSAGNVLASAAGSSPQSVATPGPATGTVYVRVRVVGIAQGSYTLSL
jgi:hypothetical protein